MSPARRPLLFAVVLLAACGSAPIAGEVRTPAPSAAAPSTTVPPDRLPPSEAAALVRLAASSPPIDTAELHEHEPAALVNWLPPEEQAQFDEQIRAAVDAAAAFVDTDTAAAQGYVRSSTQLPGIGTHWVKWSLVDAPFDPARPAM